MFELHIIEHQNHINYNTFKLTIEMREPSILTKDAVLDISMGFKKQYTLQILRLDFQKESVQLTLSDGRAIIGGIYMLPKDFKNNNLFHVYDVIKIYCEFKGDYEPILIKDFALVQEGFNQALGTSFESLSQYKKLCFLASKKQSVEVFTQSEAKKKSKLNEANCSYSHFKNVEINKPLTQKNNIDLLRLPLYSQKTQLQDKNYQEVSLKHTDTQGNYQIIPLLHGDQKRFNKLRSTLANQKQAKRYCPTIDLQQNEKNDSQTQFHVQQFQKSSEESCTVLKSQSYDLISGLYEGISSFKIICRANYVSKETNNRKEPQMRLILRDEKGNEMVAILKQTLYQGLISNKKYSMPNIIVGKTYSFIGGEVYKTKEQRLIANISWQNVKRQFLDIPEFDQSKVMTVGECAQIQSSRLICKEINLCQSNEQISNIPLKGKEVTVFGIFGGSKYKVPRYISPSLISFRGYLLDPTSKKKIQFSLSMNTDRVFYQKGTFLLLHNMRIIREQSCIKLFSSPLSYCSQQNNNAFFKRFVTIDWQEEEYENLSEPLYIYRSLKELQRISEKNELETFHSEIQCLFKEISERNRYNACSNCFSRVKCKADKYSYCISCKSTQHIFLRSIFSAFVSDSTATIELELMSEKIDGDLGLSNSYTEMNEQQRIQSLNLCKYKEVSLKIKSKRTLGSMKHYVVAVKKSDNKKVMSQIRKQSIKERILSRDSWK